MLQTLLEALKYMILCTQNTKEDLNFTIMFLPTPKNERS
jgi:hypothetical protein